MFSRKAIAHGQADGSYVELCGEIGRFFKTGKSPVTPEETIEIFAFMEAAEKSALQDGAAVSLDSVLMRAREEAEKKLANLR